MLSALKKQTTSCFLLVFSAVLIFLSCQKEISSDGGSGTGTATPDLVTKISSSVSGFVTDENDAPVMGASVQFGSALITTDKYGYFEARNVQVVKQAAVVTVSKPGYFKGIKTYMATAGKSAFFRIKLMPKTIIGTINAGTGGFIAQPNGFSVKLLAGSIVNASTNAQYTGPVTVAARWINPAAADLPNIMPGDLRGIDAGGYLKILQTYGMAAVELTGSSGELLQIVNGQKATVTIPLPATLAGTAPATIPLWYFDETKGLWKQEGSATKTGNMYTCEVGHFSFWNCDIPASYVQFNCTLKNSAGNPIPYALVKITVAGTNNSGWGCTDSSGYVGGAVPDNSNLLLEVLPAAVCSNLIYSQSFTTGNTNVSLGTITINAAPFLATLNGTVTNCSNAPVTNGSIITLESGMYTRYGLSSTGSFSFSRIFCSLPQTITLIGEDLGNAQQSTGINYTVNPGNNAVGNIQACGVTTQQFVNYSVNGTNFTLTYPGDSILVRNGNNTAIIIDAGQIGGSNSVGFSFLSQGIALNSAQPLTFFGSRPQMTIPSIQNSILVNITEYGNIGEFISGNFSGTVVESIPPNTVYNVTCSFKVRRTF